MISPGPTSDRVVVGLGASAGGLAALKTFFHHVPEKTGITFVVVMHLSAEHESHLAELLQPFIRIPVTQVSETVEIEPDHVYVIPPGCNLSAIDSHLRLSNLEPVRRERAPIDHFFRTLGATYDGKSVGIILSGTGSDGALGVRAIRENGGLTLVQDPMEAEYDGMPRTAISTGLVDRILPAAELPEAVVGYASTRPHLPRDESPESAGVEKQVGQILARVRARTGRDFSRYKSSTMVRRIQRRMQLNRIETLEAYDALLSHTPAEAASLADDLLITVTNFFRDPASPLGVTPRRVLVVDDNVDAATALRLMLELKGHKVQAVHEASEALQAVESFSPDVVLLDIELPGMSGYDIARRIRWNGNGGMMLIALTGRGQQEDKDRARDAGFDEHMTKPVDMAALGALIAAGSAGG